jgi:hypothetical protein
MCSVCSQVSDGCYWDVPIQAEGEAEVGLIVHSGDDKSAGGESFVVQPTDSEVWLVDGHRLPCMSREAAALKAIGSLQTASAHWYCLHRCDSVLTWSVGLD